MFDAAWDVIAESEQAGTMTADSSGDGTCEGAKCLAAPYIIYRNRLVGIISQLRQIERKVLVVSVGIDDEFHCRA